MDTEDIIMGEGLSDADINHAQKILKAQFPNLNGLRLTLYQDRPSKKAIDNLCKLYFVFGGITGSLEQPSVVMMVWC